MSITYYNEHATTFAEGTLSVDMQSLYQRFLPLLPAGAHIVDAGCGAGRDARYFLQQGFAVSAFDGSEQLAALASEVTGQPVQVCRFDQFVAPAPVDAIWACASLLHVPAAELPVVLAHLSQQLVSGGLFYCSFKYGCGEVSRDGRDFTNLDEDGLQQMLDNLPLAVADCWQTGDLRPGREAERWLNAILRKV